MLPHGNITKKGEQCLIMELVDGMGLNFLIETASNHGEWTRVRQGRSALTRTRLFPLSPTPIADLRELELPRVIGPRPISRDRC